MSEVLDIRLPELTGGSTEQQLRQIQSYLYSLASQLQYAFENVSREQEQVRQVQTAAQEKTPVQTFAVLKSLIIKSADIVESYSREIERRLEGKYVAQSQFGTYSQETEQKIRENAEGIVQSFRNVQALQSMVESVESAVVEINAYIRTGLLYSREDGEDVYGLEIGQQTRQDGAVRFQKFARLTADRLSFYDRNDVEVAYISDYQLHITSAQVQSVNAKQVLAERVDLGMYSWIVGADGHLTIS